MLHAVQAPGFKLTVVGGAALALALGALSTGRSHAESHRTVHRLALHAPALPDALYLTAFAMGDVFVSRDDASPQPIVFQTREELDDGCMWQGTETLTPIDGNAYFYRYDETILSCEPGVVPYEKYIRTPRTGCVTVED
jgi:hypothetical protein